MKIKRMLAVLALGVLALPCALFGCGKKTDANVYNFVLTNATIPPVMAALDCLDNDATTYMWYGRKQTFTDVTKLGFNMIKQEESVGTGISADALDQMSNQVVDLYVKDKKSHFNLYVTDYAVEAAFKMFIANQIPEDNYTVKLVEDGTGSYSNFKTLYGGADGKTKFESDISKLNTAIEKVKNNTYTYNVGGSSSAEQAAAYHYNMSFVYAATYDNVEYWLQYPEYIKSEDPGMATYIDDIDFEKANLTQMYNKLSEKDKTTLKEAVFDVSYIDPIMRNSNGKKTLVICGTSLGGEELGRTLTDGVKNGTDKQRFEDVFDKIVEDYGDDYNIVIKPHPSWGLADEDHNVAAGGNWASQNCTGAYDRRVQYCETNHITVLPGQVPMEVLIWAYGDNIKIGGYSSSLYMNAPKDMTLFLILTNNTTALQENEPLPNIIEEGKLASTLKVYYPDPTDGTIKVDTKTYPAA